MSNPQAASGADSSSDQSPGLLVRAENYRADIDGLRAIAVIAVIIFHLGYLPEGFLGVDVFFVISGYLITKIIFSECSEGKFSLVNFYLRRTRRIIPLVCAVNIVVLIFGIAWMLPDDLENLSQSIIATNFFGNNVLQWMTTANYWDVVNEYKPMMHTWSLGVEEQYYMLYPLLFLPLGRGRTKLLLAIIGVLTLVSLGLCFSGMYREASVFYLLPFRFFELSIGGIAAVLLNGRLINHKFAWLPLLLLIGMLIVTIPGLSPPAKSLLAVVLTLLVLISNNRGDKVASAILENRLAVGIGLMSFSLYMWHQPVLAFARYVFFEHIGLWHALGLTALIFAMSAASYFLVEQPFRDKKKVSTKVLLITVISAVLLTTAIPGWIYLRAGVVREVPELDIVGSGPFKRGMHAANNSRIYAYVKDFESEGKLKVMVIGNSFARDWTNLLLSSKYADDIELSYYFNTPVTDAIRERVRQADVVFVNTANAEDANRKFDLDPAKTWYFGTKNFGVSNGIFYNYRGDDYYSQRTKVDGNFLNIHLKDKEKFGDRYVNILDKVMDERSTVPVFTSDKRFISQDCRHFTRAGAAYFAKLMEPDLDLILGPGIEKLKAGPQQ